MRERVVQAPLIPPCLGKGDMNNLITSFSRCLFLLAVLSLCLTVAYAQTETGQIAGTIFDPSGAAIPNATVTVKSVETGATRTTTTSESGAYIVTNLLPGTYAVIAT